MSLAKYFKLYKDYGFFNSSIVRVRIPDTSFYGSDLILSKDGQVLRTRTIDGEVTDISTDESGVLTLSADNGTSTLSGTVTIEAYGTYNITLTGGDDDREREVYASKNVTLDAQHSTDTVSIGYTGDVASISAVSSNPSVCNVSVNGHNVIVTDAGKDFTGRSTITATVSRTQGYDAGEVNFYVNKTNGTLGTWQDASDSVITSMVAQADAGEIDLGDYWEVGDVRRVHLDAIAAGTTIGNQPEQDVDLVLLHYAANSAYYDLTDPITSGRRHPMFIVGVKDCLLNKTNAAFVTVTHTDTYTSGHYQTKTLYAFSNSGVSETLSWLDDNITSSLPDTINTIFKEVSVYHLPNSGDKSASGSRDLLFTDVGKKSLKTTLPSTKELGIIIPKPTSTSEVGCFDATSTYNADISPTVQSNMNYGEVLSYYTYAENRVKKKGINGSPIDYFTRNMAMGTRNDYQSSIYSVKCAAYVDSNGNPQTLNTDSSDVRNISRGISPIMFI